MRLVNIVSSGLLNKSTRKPTQKHELSRVIFTSAESHGILPSTLFVTGDCLSMHKKFDSREIETKWQQLWEEQKLYEVGERDHSKPKEYVLVEWPYPSGNLHIGHWYAFAVPDIYARFKRMSGTQILFPMGFDAFGLPAENAAIKRNLDPKEWTNDNIAYMRHQLARMGNSFAWDKTANSTDPSYYKWTQSMFTKFFENGIAYRGKGIVNWCPGCNTVIANEQVLTDGTCERSGDVIEKKEMPQWMLRITKYADRLTDELADLDWPEHIKEAQRQWIGRSRGAEIDFKLSTGNIITVFTTRPDTLYGATYLVLAPEHPLIEQNATSIRNIEEVRSYVAVTKQKDEQDRLDATKEKTGVKLEGITAINPGSGEEIPVFIADYVLGGYGTGAIMAVPAHDERDYDFAKKFNIAVKQVVVPCASDSKNPPQAGFEEVKRDTVIVHLRDVSTGKFALLNWHATLEGVTTAIMGGIEPGQTPEDAALAEIAEEAALQGVMITKKLKWITAAKYCASHKNQNRCAHSYAFLAEISDLKSQGIISELEQKTHTLVWVDEAEVLAKLTPDHQKQIWELLQVETALTGNGYLINSAEFDDLDNEEAKEKITTKVGGRMTATYRIRDWSIGRQRYWGVPIPIVYSPEGVAQVVPEEHLPWLLPEDVDFRPTGEAPLAKSASLKERTEAIFGPGWTPEVETMDTFVDSSWYFLRYLDNQNETSLASLEKQKDWMPIDIYFGGAEHTTMHLLYSRFWQKALFDLGLVTENEPYRRRINRGLILGPDGNKMSKSKGNVIDPDEQVALVGSDTVKMYLAFMGPYEGNNYPWDMGGIAGLRRFLERVYGLPDHFVESENENITRQLHKTIAKISSDIEEFKFNTAISTMMIFVNLAEKEGLTKDSFTTFIQVLAPFAPHITEEIWQDLGYQTSVHVANYPTADEGLAKDVLIQIGVQINGKMRGTIDIAPTATEHEAMVAIMSNVSIAARLANINSSKVIYIPGRIINLILPE